MPEPEMFIIPIPLRSDLTVKIQLPLNLSESEAEKIGAVVRAFAFGDGNPAFSQGIEAAEEE